MVPLSSAFSDNATFVRILRYWFGRHKLPILVKFFHPKVWDPMLNTRFSRVFEGALARRATFWGISDSDASSNPNSPMPTEASSSSNSAFISQPTLAPKPKAKPKPKPKPAAPEREFTKDQCEKENKKSEEQILEYLLAVSGKMAHPLHTSKEGVQWWCQLLCGMY